MKKTEQTTWIAYYIAPVKKQGQNTEGKPRE